MKTLTMETSPQVYARMAGLLYIVVIAAGIVSQMLISGKLVVDGDAAATAANILAHKDLFQLGFTLYLVEMACQAAQMAFFYILLKPVSRNMAFLALSLGLVGCAIKTFGRVFYIAPLLVLGGVPYLGVFSAGQLQSLALLLLNINSQAAGMALPFFGLSTCLNGILMIRSGFLPRILGILAVVGGLGWLTFLHPPLGLQLFAFVVPFALLGSVLTILWLLIKGVNVEQWTNRAIESAG